MHTEYFRQPDSIDADNIVRALNAKRNGRSWLARCPVHDDRTPSLSIAQAEDRVLVHCHAGCSQEAVINALRSRGLWPGEATHAAPRPRQPQAPPPKPDDLAAKKSYVRRIWSEAGPVAATPAERYFLERRQLDVSHLNLTHALRWHRGIHAVVGLMRDAVSGEATGVHRAFLDGEGAKIERKMFGPQGAVRLSPDDLVTMGLGITEGIEDGLAVLLSGWAPIWAATSAGAMARFPVLAGIEALTIFADADDTGIDKARECAARWHAAGREVRIVHPGRAAHA